MTLSPEAGILYPACFPKGFKIVLNIKLMEQNLLNEEMSCHSEGGKKMRGLPPLHYKFSSELPGSQCKNKPQEITELSESGLGFGLVLVS